MATLVTGRSLTTGFTVIATSQSRHTFGFGIPGGQQELEVETLSGFEAGLGLVLLVGVLWLVFRRQRQHDWPSVSGLLVDLVSNVENLATCDNCYLLFQG